MEIIGSLAVVTGASSGIGAATARLLARVALLARDATRLEEVAADIRPRQGKADSYVVNLADAEQIAATARTILRRIS